MLGWPTCRLLIYLFVYQPTCTTLGLTRACNETNRVGRVEGPTLGSWVTHPLSVLPSVPTSYPWNKHQTPCKPCTKQGMWNQTWYIPLIPRGHNYTLKQCEYLAHLIMPKLIVFITSIYFPEYCTSFTVSQDLLCRHLHDFVSHRWIKGNIEGMGIQKMTLNLCLGSKLVYSPPSTAMHYHT